MTNEQTSEANKSEIAQLLPATTIPELPQTLQDAVERAGWTELMPVQAQSIPYLIARQDLMVQSKTGSGKTGAFILPTLDIIDTSKDSCQVLIMVPTRELAEQVAKEAKMLAGDSGLRAVPVYGGVRYKKQLAAFKEGAHLVVGTPGRILDHLLKRNLKLNDLKVLIFDEADRLLSIGFYPDMKEIQRYLPERRVQSYMFSATFPPRVRGLASRFLNKPDFLSLSSDNDTDGDIDHIYYLIPGMEKDRGLVRIIEAENPDNAIIFCNTKQRVHYVSVVLQRFGYDADELSGDINQNARDRVLSRLRKGTLRFLVATDVAARGIDIPDLSHVFQFEIPEDQEVYVHRAGRTGRAGSSGKAITLVDVLETGKLRRIEKQYKLDIREEQLPSEEDLATLVSDRAEVLLENKLRTRDKLAAERMERFVPMATEMAQTEEGQRIIAMLLDDYYQASLHAPVIPVKKQEKQQSTSNNYNKKQGGRNKGGNRSGGNRNRNRGNRNRNKN